MTDSIKDMWLEQLHAQVESLTMSTGIPPVAWTTAGRPTKDKPMGEDLNWWETDGLRQIEGYAKWLDTTDWVIVDFDGVPGIEYPIDVQFGPQRIKGYIDLVMATPDGELVILDVKTGSRTPDSELQLGIYAAALELMGYPRPSLGSFWMTRKGEHTEPVSLDRYSISMITEMFDMFGRAVEGGIFIPHISSYCKGCSVRDACAAVGGTDAWKYDPLHPAYTGLHTQDRNTPTPKEMM